MLSVDKHVHKQLTTLQGAIISELEWSFFTPVAEMAPHFAKIQSELDIVDDDYFTTTFLQSDTT